MFYGVSFYPCCRVSISTKAEGASHHVRRHEQLGVTISKLLQTVSVRHKLNKLLLRVEGRKSWNWLNWLTCAHPLNCWLTC